MWEGRKENKSCLKETEGITEKMKLCWNLKNEQ